MRTGQEAPVSDTRVIMEETHAGNWWAFHRQQPVGESAQASISTATRARSERPSSSSRAVCASTPRRMIRRVSRSPNPCKRRSTASTKPRATFKTRPTRPRSPKAHSRRRPTSCSAFAPSRSKARRTSRRPTTARTCSRKSSSCCSKSTASRRTRTSTARPARRHARRLPAAGRRQRDDHVELRPRRPAGRSFDATVRVVLPTTAPDRRDGTIEVQVAQLTSTQQGLIVSFFTSASARRGRGRHDRHAVGGG